jgi:anti-sigma regulatory factor (Ser/Thr protein kinase)
MEIEACESACAVAELIRMSPDKIDEVRMAVVEACINAIEHSEAEDGLLYLNIAVLGHDRPEILQITVRDHGVGFDRDTIVPPKIQDKIGAASKRGWGLKIIEGLMDDVVVHSGEAGTSVVMSKALADRAPANDKGPDEQGARRKAT